MSNPILKIKRGSGTPIGLETGELAMDLLNKSLFIGTDAGVLAIGGEHVFAKKSYVDSAVSTEQTAREAADTTLTTNLNAEIARATAAEGVNASAISAEETARIAGDSALDAKITTEKGRIDAILSAAEADKDSFAEIVSLINSVDTENDTAFAGYVTSNNAALAQEVTDRASADTALGLRIDGVESDATALEARVTTAEADIVTNATAISTEASTRASADTTLQSNIDAEASTRAAADTSLSNRITAIETVSPSSRLDAVEADVADHETRISALETVIDGGSY